MTEEKLLAFLNLNKSKKIDKTMMNIVLWFDVGFSLMIIVFGMLLRCIDFTCTNMVIMFFMIIVDIIFFVLIRATENPVGEILHTPKIILSSIIKLLYGYWIFAKKEVIEYGYPLFTWLHAIVLILCIIGSVYMIVKFVKVYQELQKSTLKSALKKIKKESKVTIWLLRLSVIFLMIFVILFRTARAKLGIGIGFFMWSLACIWFLFVLVLIPKYVIAKKYDIYNLFKGILKEKCG